MVLLCLLALEHKDGVVWQEHRSYSINSFVGKEWEYINSFLIWGFSEIYPNMIFDVVLPYKHILHNTTLVSQY